MCMRAAGQSSETKKCNSQPEGDLIKITNPGIYPPVKSWLDKNLWSVPRRIAYM